VEVIIEAILQFAAFGLIYGAFALLAILVHEFGHASAHLICRHRVVSIRVGPLNFEPPRKWSWSWRWKKLLSGGVLPQLRQPPGRWTSAQLFLCYLAGPVANILAALVAFRIAFGDTILSGLFGWFAIVSCLVGLGQFLPFRIGRITSDGTKLYSILLSRKRRSHLLSASSITLRLEEFSKAYREDRNEDALRLANDLIAFFNEIPGADPNQPFFQKLVKIRDHLEAHRACGETCQVEAARPLISPPTPPSPSH
jgi:hypothetical protein